tara:strand:- start:823 stop:936 length:114 start_codon:yes stop_codon:yes gene_type:complete
LNEAFILVSIRKWSWAKILVKKRVIDRKYVLKKKFKI